MLRFKQFLFEKSKNKKDFGKDEKPKDDPKDKDKSKDKDKKDDKKQDKGPDAKILINPSLNDLKQNKS